MTYKNIEDYLSANNHFDKPVNELWIVDNVAIKSIEIKNLLPKNFHPKIVQNEINELLKTFFFDSEKVVINSFEKEILIKKIIELPENQAKFKKLEGNITNLISCIDGIRLYPSYKKRFEKSKGSKISNTSLLVKDLVEELLVLFRAECEKNNFIDDVEIKLFLAELKEMKLTKYDRIVIYGNFLPVDEITWKILQNFCFSSTEEIIFVSSMSELVKSFFDKKDFMEFQDNVKDYFFSDKPISLQNQMKNLDPSKVTYSKFSDWDEELNYIAREIKKAIIEENLLPEEVGLYIPKEDLYSFKVEKVLKDFELPYRKSYSQTLSKVPLGNFFRWFMELDFNLVTDCFKLLKSAFTTINFEDFKIPKGEKLSFNNKEFSSDNLKIEHFDFLWLENVLTTSGISFFSKEDENFKKLEESFKRKFQYELKRNNSDNEIEEDFQKAYYSFKYFKNKIDEISVILPKSCTPEQFKEATDKLLSELKIDNKFINTNPEIPTHYTSSYNALKSMIEGMTKSLTKLDNKVYSLDEYLKLYIKQAENNFFKDEEVGAGILITELAYISKVSFKRVYQVGMSSSSFPTGSSKNTFSAFLELFKPIGVRETQLGAFVELLNNTVQKKDFTLHLSYPVIINNQEDEPSEVFADLALVLPDGKLEIKPKKYALADKIYSNSEKYEALAKEKFPAENDIKKLLLMTQKRNNLMEWSEYEGYLNFLDEDLSIGHTSISKVEEFAKCSMKYFFNQKLKLKKSGKTFKDIDATLKGTLIHKILELYYIESQDKAFFKDKNLLCDESKSLLLEIAESNFKTYEESLNNLYIDRLKDQFIAGLAIDDNRNGILSALLESDQKRLEEGIIPSHFEYNFEYPIHGLNFKGVIDRVDNYENEPIFDVIDYKTGSSFDPSEKRTELQEGLSYQLTVYSEAYAYKEKRKIKEGGYYVLNKIDKEDKICFSPVLCDDKIEDDDKKNKKNKEKSRTEIKRELYGIPKPKALTVEEKVKNNLAHLKDLKDKLLNSEYTYTLLDQEKVCEYCDFKTICRYNENKADLFKPKESSPRKLEFDFLNREMFSFPEKSINSDSGLTDEQKKALDFERNIIVTAGAGAGKTATLTDRMFKLLDKVDGDIEKILVVTFTKKATAEMQNRIYGSIVKKLSESNVEDISFIKKAKLNFKKNWISTLDSFYQRILKENILELDIDSELDISDQKDLLVLINDTVEKKIDELAVLRDKRLSSLLETWKRDQIIQMMVRFINLDWIEDFINKPNDEIQNKYRESYLKQAKTYLEFLDNFESKIPQVSENEKINKFFKVAFELIGFYRSEINKFTSTPDDFKYHNTYEKELRPNKTPFQFPRLGKPEKEILNGLNDEITEVLRPSGSKAGEISVFLFLCQYLNLEKETLFSLISLLKEIKTEYDSVKIDRKILTFSDISLKLFRLLSDSPQIRKKLSSKFDFIMVDEFQDTNIYQYDIAKYLAGWDGIKPESIDKNKLFFVGDEKQAIYQFRGGDVQVFNRAKSEVDKINDSYKLASGQILFPHNFRSRKNLVNFFNNFFNKVFSPANESGKKIYEVTHEKFLISEKEISEPKDKDLISLNELGSVNFFLFNRGEKQLKELRQNTDLEAKSIAMIVKKILFENPKEEIAILFRTRKKIQMFANSLEKLGINYVIYGGTGFYENQEIQDLLNILTYLTDEKRILEFAGFLRSPMGNLSDNQILELRQNFKKGLKEKHISLHTKIFGLWEEGKLVKKGWKQLSCDLKIHELIEKIINDTSFRASLHLESSSIQKLKNLERFIEIAKEKYNNTLEEFIELIEFQIENEIEESNATIIEVGEVKPVQLMTIHKSKGLGFSTVIIADAAAESFKPHTESFHTGDLEILHSDDILKEFIGFKLKNTIENFEVKTYTKQTILNLINNKEEAELKRLLYVAMTRAKNNLIVSASCWNDLFQMGKKAQTMFRFMIDYFDGIVEEDGSLTPLQDLVLMPPPNNVLEPEIIEKKLIKGIPFYIFNDSYELNLEKEVELSTLDYLSIAEKINVSKPQIYAYSNIKGKENIIKKLVINDKEIKITLYKNESIKIVDYDKSLGNKKDEDGKFKKLRGNTIHQLLEHDIISEKFAKNMLKNKLPAELIDNASQHYLNLKIILADISKNIVSDYDELPFLEGQLTGIFDKLVKTNDGWEIWDYKVSDSFKPESIISEIEEYYKIQYKIYTQELSKLLDLKEVKYKLLFSNFGVVEITDI